MLDNSTLEKHGDVRVVSQPAVVAAAMSSMVLEISSEAGDPGAARYREQGQSGDGAGKIFAVFYG